MKRLDYCVLLTRSFHVYVCLCVMRLQRHSGRRGWCRGRPDTASRPAQWFGVRGLRCSPRGWSRPVYQWRRDARFWVWGPCKRISPRIETVQSPAALIYIGPVDVESCREMSCPCVPCCVWICGRVSKRQRIVNITRGPLETTRNETDEGTHYSSRSDENTRYLADRIGPQSPIVARVQRTKLES